MLQMLHKYKGSTLDSYYLILKFIEIKCRMRFLRVLPTKARSLTLVSKYSMLVLITAWILKARLASFTAFMELLLQRWESIIIESQNLVVVFTMIRTDFQVLIPYKYLGYLSGKEITYSRVQLQYLLSIVSLHQVLPLNFLDLMENKHHMRLAIVLLTTGRSSYLVLYLMVAMILTELNCMHLFCFLLTKARPLMFNSNYLMLSPLIEFGTHLCLFGEILPSSRGVYDTNTNANRKSIAHLNKSILAILKSIVILLITTETLLLLVGKRIRLLPYLWSSGTSTELLILLLIKTNSFLATLPSNFFYLEHNSTKYEYILLFSQQCIFHLRVWN